MALPGCILGCILRLHLLHMARTFHIPQSTSTDTSELHFAPEPSGVGLDLADGHLDTHTREMQAEVDRKSVM